MFPEFTPNIRMEDTRLAEIAESMRQRILNPPKGVTAQNLEFEAKLGSIELNDLFIQQVDQLQRAGDPIQRPVQRLLDQSLRSQTWEMLQDPKSFSDMPTAYNFKVNLHGYGPEGAEVSERDIFAWMLHRVEAQCQQNPFLKALPRRRIKDVIHRNKVRESFELDPATGQFPSTPTEVIRKTRISD